MTIVVAEIRKKQKQLEKQTAKAVNIIFESNFGENACSRVDELIRKYNPETRSLPRRKISIRTEEDPKRIIAWAIAQRIREARESQGLTQDALAGKTGIARPNIARLEQGQHMPTLSTLQKIARVLYLDMNSLMAQPEVTQKDRLEFTEITAAGLDEWVKQLEEEDAKV
ncbi:MAG: helix-turn-helix transcriptional regulator [Nitrospirota bacterium]